MQSNIIKYIPLELNYRLSVQFNANIYFQREDLQNTRSFEIRGIVNKLKKYPNIEHVVTYNSGNHAISTAYVCQQMAIYCTIFIPISTPMLKHTRLLEIGCKVITVDNDDCYQMAMNYSLNNNYLFIDPINDIDLINGFYNISNDINSSISPDIIISPINGGNLIAGQLQYKKENDKKYTVIGVEPIGADVMNISLKFRQITKIDDIDNFVDNCVQETGQIAFNMCQEMLDKDIITIDNNHMSYHLVKLYQDDGIIVEPNGVLSVCALDIINQQQDINEKNIVCIISSGNNDIMRYTEFIERSLIYQKLIHYYIIKFDQRPGALGNFMKNVLDGTTIDIIRFEYIKKTNKSHGSVLLGVELKQSCDIAVLNYRMNINNIKYLKVNPNDTLFDFIV